MPDSISDDHVVMERDEYVVSILATGIALQVLAQKTGTAIETWMEYVSEKAVEQFGDLSEVEIQRVIDIYEAARKA